MNHKLLDGFEISIFLLILLTTFLSGGKTEDRFKPPNRTYPDSRPDKIASRWNKTLEKFGDGKMIKKEPRYEPHVIPVLKYSIPEKSIGFAASIRRCVSDRKREIIENYNRGKVIVVNCFKAALILSFLRYLTMSPNTSIKLFNGFLEFVKIPETSGPCEGSNEVNDCSSKLYGGYFENNIMSRTGNEYVYNRIVKEVVDDVWDNSEEGKIPETKRRSHFERVVTYLSNEKSEKAEEEQIKRELADPKLLSVLTALSRHYLMKINIFPSTWLEVKRNFRGGFMLDLITTESRTGESRKNKDEIEDNEEDDEDEEDDFDDDDDDDDDNDVDGGNQLESSKKTAKIIQEQEKSGRKKKKKKLKKFKHFKHLLIPFLIQIAILPFFLKNLLFLAMKALLAGKAALLLVVFNMLRNSKIEDENYNIRVEHYGYRKGEEYGAWINGRSFQGGRQSMVENLSDEPYRKSRPKFR